MQRPRIVLAVEAGHLVPQLTEERHGLGRAPTVGQAQAELELGAECVGVVFPEHFPANTGGLLQLLCRLPGPAESEQRQTDGLPGRGFEGGLAGEARCDPVSCPEHHLHHRDILGESSRRLHRGGALPCEPRILLQLQGINRGQHAVEEVVDRLRGRRLAPRLEQPHRRQQQSDHQGGGHGGPNGDAGTIPSHELASAVEGAGGTGQHRFVGQEALDVHAHPVGRLVAAGAVLLQGLHDDPVQIAPQRSGQTRKIGVALLRRRGG